MIPWETLDTANIPGGSETLRLKRRGTEFSIMLGANELMNSRLSGSEAALARLTIERLAASAPRILIGGLGLGFTLRAALPLLTQAARITVVELVPAVVAWARGPLAALHGDSLDDPRVTIVENDIGAIIGERPAAWDAILLDVDNGPEGLSRKGNDLLYDARGLRAAFTALAPGGVLSVWSSGPNAPFTRRLRQAGFTVEDVAVRAGTTRRGARHVIWLATRPSTSRA
ncbi:spermidine synthase [Nitratireductor thuwali]|uniref:Polyamine aminopropyltransferase n=1 Tax=Nitratireductor thuwali TaxID=2267699 RepID=A0ABY5MNI2_9HYPH|nr:Polyamine aminopropyltransferase [Nitratireductor thuwali]